MGRDERDDDFRARYGPWALVAGASDGIGECFARALARRGTNLVLLARREPLLADLAAELRARHGIETRCLPADLTGDDLDRRVADATDDLEVGLLVYNAGAVHGARPFHDPPVEIRLVHVQEIRRRLGRAGRHRR